MRGKRFKRVFGALAVGGLLMSVTAVTTHSASGITSPKEVATGKATGSIDTEGNFSGTVSLAGKDGAKGTVDLTGVLAPGSGIGKRTAKLKTTSDDQGQFSTSFKSKKSEASGTVSGSLSQPGGGPPAPSNLSIDINCTITYPPLTINCTVTIGWSAA